MASPLLEVFAIDRTALDRPQIRHAAQFLGLEAGGHGEIATAAAGSATRFMKSAQIGSATRAPYASRPIGAG